MLFTSFTPTINGRHTRLRHFESLEVRTIPGLERLWRDGGATDGTGKSWANWSRAASFRLRYHYQANGGKHVAASF